METRSRMPKSRAKYRERTDTTVLELTVAVLGLVSYR